uniref:Uncharacterized protein n=1 Tax=Anas platyrhynchos TaxID=8839 RepID=A0A8B9TUL8_ANAPL
MDNVNGKVKFNVGPPFGRTSYSQDTRGIPLRSRKHLEKSLWKADKVEVMHMLKGFHLGSCFYHVYMCQHQIAMLCQMNKFVPLLCILDGDRF